MTISYLIVGILNLGVDGLIIEAVGYSCVCVYGNHQSVVYNPMMGTC